MACHQRSTLRRQRRAQRSPTTSSTIALSGSASDNIGVSQVSWSNSKGGNGVATGTTCVVVAGVSLQPGANVITVTAKDAAGNVATGRADDHLTDRGTAATIAMPAPTAADDHDHGNGDVRSAARRRTSSASPKCGGQRSRWQRRRRGHDDVVGAAARASAWRQRDHRDRERRAGNTSSDRITITADSKAPTIAIAAPAATAPYVTKAETVSLAGTRATSWA
jgi:hypothetical protein